MVGKISAPHIPQIKINGAGSQRTDDRFIPDDYKNVAKGMEQQFAEYMLQQMNNTIDKSEDESQDSAQTYYENMLTTERSKMMAEARGGLGVQKIVLNQIYPERLRTELNYNNYQKMKEQNALHHKMIQTHKKAESNPIAMNKEEGPKMAPAVAKGEVE